YFLLGGIQLLGTDLFQRKSLDSRTGKAREPSVRTVIKHALCRQLDALARRGIVTHWEIGGINSPQLLDDLAEIAKGRIKSASLNHTELKAITEGPEFPPPRYHYPLPAALSNILDRYNRALHVARALDLDELYVHGNDVDLIIRRRTTRGALRQELA